MKRALQAFALLLLVALPAAAQRKDDIAFRSTGGTLGFVANPQVRVCASGSTGVTCTPSIIYTSTAFTSVATNPFTGDAVGNYYFYAARGCYDVYVTDPLTSSVYVQKDVCISSPQPITDWNSVTRYHVGDVVDYFGVLYVSIVGGFNRQPDVTSGVYWEPVGHSLIGGGTTAKQVSGGPELMGCQNAASTRVCLALFVGSEANARFLLDMHGNLEWGPGSADQDVLLYRAFTGMMAFAGLPGGGIEVLKETTYGVFEAQARMILANDGTGLLYTDGTNAADTQVYRAYAGGLNVAGTSGGGINVVRWTAPFTNEAYPRISIVNDGAGIKFGSGSATPDVSIAYPATGLLNISATSAGGVGVRLTTDSFQRMFLGNDGKGITFGSGAIASDVSISRFGTGSLAVGSGSGYGDMSGQLRLGTLIATAATPSVGAGQVGFGNTTATSATAGTNGAVPAQVVGYLIVNVGGSAVKVPYFAN